MTTCVSRKDVLVKEQSRKMASDSLKVKSDKKAYMKKEAHQVAKEAAGFVCNRAKGSVTSFPPNMRVCRTITPCAKCGDTSGELYLVNGKLICRICKKGVAER